MTLADPERVAKSRQFPFRFLAAYNAAPSLRWSWAPEKALNASLSNVPSLPGRRSVPAVLKEFADGRRVITRLIVRGWAL